MRCAAEKGMGLGLSPRAARARPDAVRSLGFAVAWLVLVAWTPGAGADCGKPAPLPSGPWQRDEKTGVRTLGVEADVDGDGRPDRVQVIWEGGFRSGARSAEVHLAGSGRRYAAEAQFSSNSMLTRVPVPAELRDWDAPEAAAARAWIESALFGTLCDTPDPSLAWLLREPKRLVWETGPPPRWMASYAWLDREGDEPAWIYYSGSDHMYEPVSSDPRPTGVPPTLGRGMGAARGALAAIATEHGVILFDRAGLRHAWIYVFPGGPGLGPRESSIRGVRFEENEVVIDVRRSATRSAVVRVSLPDGSLREL